MKDRDKKIVMAIAVLAAAAAVIVNVLSGALDSEASYISAAPEKVGYSEVKEYLNKVNFSGRDEKKYFSKKVVNQYTLKYFKFLQKRFKDQSFEDHLQSVYKYLLSVLDQKEAEALFEIYKKYLEYEKHIAAALNRKGDLKSTGDFLEVLKMMRDVQVEYFGEDYADIMFGPLLKAQEYPIRRAAVVNDENMYASEKLEKLEVLNRDMWADEGAKVESSMKPYVAYTEKISIYSKDLSEMPEDQKNVKIRELRESVFPSDVVKRLEEVDRQLASEKETYSEYKEKYESIMNDSSLDDSEKLARTSALRNETYGKDADAVERRESIESERQKLLNSIRN